MSALRVGRRDFMRGRLRVPVDAPCASVASDGPETMVAKIDASACLASMQQVCTSCREHCSLRAIRFEGLFPWVDEARCTGCGACAQVCPAPFPAISMQVTRERR